MPVLENVIQRAVPQDDIGYLLPSDARIHVFGQATSFSVDIQDGKAIPFTLR